MAISHKKGEYFALSSGEYSDYSFNGLFVALQDIDLAFEAQDFLATQRMIGLLESRPIPPDADDYDLENAHGITQSAFSGFLVKKGVVREIEYDEIHCGYTFSVSEVVSYIEGRLANQAAKAARAASITK